MFKKKGADDNLGDGREIAKGRKKHGKKKGRHKHSGRSTFGRKK